MSPEDIEQSNAHLPEGEENARMTDSPHKKKRKRKEKVGKCNSNNQREKVTVPSTVERTTMTLKWRTPKQHHNNNVGDSRS